MEEVMSVNLRAGNAIPKKRGGWIAFLFLVGTPSLSLPCFFFIFLIFI
jgi:hypothetical protein